MTIVVRNIPPENVTKVRQVFGGGRIRARGKRVINGRRYFQDLPAEYAERFSLYVGRGNCYVSPYDYCDLVGFDPDGRVRVRMIGGQK